MVRLLPVTFLALLAAAPARADLDPEADKPYDHHVVLSLAEHRVFTPVFRENLERDLRDSLRTAFADLAKVTVVREHPLLDEVRARGLRQALDGWRLVGDTKTHFVHVRFRDGHYEVEARQHDGSTGLASPDVRQSRTGDRNLVARTAALMIAKDFGAVGTLAPAANPQQGQKCTVTLKGGRLGPALGHVVRKDDVFVLAQITQAAGGLRSALVADAVLQVVEGPRDGRCECRLYYRYVDPLAAGPGVLGYRCLKIATTESPLRLRVVRGDKSREPLNALTVALSTTPEAAPAETQSTNLNEPVTSRQAYRNLAFVRISKAGVHLAGPFPVPVLGDVPVTCPVGVAPEAEKRGAVAARLRHWERRWYDASVIYAKVVTDFNKTSGKAPEAALKASRQGLGLLRTELLHLGGEFRALRAEAAKVKPDLRQELADSDQRLQELHQRYATLEKHIGDLETVLAKQNDPRIKEWQAMLQRARVLETELEIDPALALYEKVLKEAPNAGEGLHEHVAKLRRDWAVRDDEHRDARAFVFQTWPTLADAARVKERLPDALRYYKVLREAKDVLTLRKLLRVSKDFAAKLAKEYDALRPDASDDDRRAAEAIAETTAELGKLIKAVSEDVEKP